ncbi:hypothetical protein [Mycobacteroides abscessus]|uniref:hypothetical protein n=1 Tax=Mycobacteroides abscessus TaxID=36809 RepID=UPI0012E8D50D|nr:hypothetical protein [Mycobacteroides abscessus]
MDEIEIAALRDEAKNQVKRCDALRGEHAPDAVVLFDRTLAVAKVQALVSISGELELIRKHLQQHGLEPEFKTSS